MTTLQKIVAKAKALKKAAPKKFSKWTDYIKAASKGMKKPAPVKKVKKKTVKKSVSGVKKTAPKKRATKKSATHKDTKSHNVNIRVVSGVDSFGIMQLKQVAHKIKSYESGINDDTVRLKNSKSAQYKSFFKIQIKRKREHIANLKKQMTLIKKSIK